MTENGKSAPSDPKPDIQQNDIKNEAATPESNTKPRAERQRRDWLDYANLAVLVAAFIAALAAALESKRLADLTQDLARDSAVGLIDANRAWIAPETIQFSVPIESDQIPRVVVTYQNVGRFPAVDLRIGLGPITTPLIAPLKSIEILPEAPLWASLGAIFDERCSKNEPLNGANIAYPSRRVEGNVEIGIMSEWNSAIKADVLAGKQIIVVGGCFTYRTMNQVFHTGFCKYFYPLIGKPSTTWPARNCPVGNFDR